MTTPSNEHLLALLEAVIREAPALEYDQTLSPSELIWLGRAEAILDAANNLPTLMEFRAARNALESYSHNRNAVLLPLQVAYHRLELTLPTSAQGAFIPGNSNWNGFAALVQVLQPPCSEQFLVDPYLDASVYLDLAPMSGATQKIRCLAVKRNQLHSGIVAAGQKWASESGKLPIEIRYAEARELHDRLIICDTESAWLVSQSFKDIAKKSPGSIQRADHDLMQAKIAHYNDVWDRSVPAF